VVYEAAESSSSSDEEIVYVQRKKPNRKPKAPKQPRIVYVTDSDDERDVYPTAAAPLPVPAPAAMSDWYKFV
jgi:hypothetical protein